MLENEIAGIALSHLASIGLTDIDKPERFSFANTIKPSILEAQALVLDSNSLQINMPVADYYVAILNDLHFGAVRVKEQCKSVNILINSAAQPAWTLISAYYAAYFIATDIAKACGRFVINLDENELSQILANSLSGPHEGVERSASSYIVSVEHGDMSGEVKMTLKKTGARPHKMAWSNFSQLTNKMKIEEGRFSYFELLQNIVSPSNTGWELPSEVRNTWNYSKTDYYGNKGNDLAKTFSSIIRSKDSTYLWARKNTLKPTEQNIPATISYVYHLLLLAHKQLINRLKLT